VYVVPADLKEGLSTSKAAAGFLTLKRAGA
jgi:hypothetical protein